MFDTFSSTCLKNFEKVGLDGQVDVLFKKRYDTKYIFSPELLKTILVRLSPNYRVLNINNNYIQDYESLYFDNSEFKFYLEHHNGKLNRYKIRFRRYLQSKLIFIEIKFKNNKNQTKKWREEINETSYFQNLMTEKERSFINTFLRQNPGQLYPRVKVTYSRLTLIHKEIPERITIDLNLSYLKNGETKNYKNIVIAEVKQRNLGQYSDFFNIMHEHKILPLRFSKYCFGIASFIHG